MYAITGVVRPSLNPADLTRIADNYRLLASAASAARATTASAVATVLDPMNNEGTEVIEAFEATVTGASSVQDHLREIADAAAATQVAYEGAALVATEALVSMDYYAREGGRAFWKAFLGGASASDLALLVQVVTNQLTNTEAVAAAKVTDLFEDVDLPSPLPSNDQITWGTVPPEIIALWEELDIDERKALLQELANQFADENGIPRQTLIWDLGPGDPWGQRQKDGSIHMNEYLLMANDGDEDYPSAYMLNIVIHEMEHSWQYEVMNSDTPGDYGVSQEERDRMIELNQRGVREKGRPRGWQEGDYDPSYTPRPVEVGARQAGRDFLDGLTVQELRDML